MQNIQDAALSNYISLIANIDQNWSDVRVHFKEAAVGCKVTAPQELLWYAE